MTDHIHDWKPTGEVTASTTRFRCQICSAEGWRPTVLRRNGMPREIVEYKRKPVQIKPEVTAYERDAGSNAAGGYLPPSHKPTRVR